MVENELEELKDQQGRFYAFRLADLLRTRNHLEDPKIGHFADYEGIPIGRVETHEGVVPGLMYGINHGIAGSFRTLKKMGLEIYAQAIIDCYNDQRSAW